MFVKDLNTEDREEAIGACTNDRAYRIFTEAAELLADKGLIDDLVGTMTICCCSNFTTLPPEVDTPLAVSVDGCPAILRNQWFDYHVNGPGERDWTPVGYADILGNNFCTARDPESPVKLGLIIRSVSDANRMFRVYGTAQNGERIYQRNAAGDLQDGFLVPSVYDDIRPAADIAAIAQIERISLEEFADYVDLVGIDPDTNEVTTLLGRYRPGETTPRYTRIRVPARNSVRVKFRRAVLPVVGEDDWLPIDHKRAFLTACQAVAARRAKRYDEAAWMEREAERMIRERQRSRTPGGISPPQVTVSPTNQMVRPGLHY